MRNSEATNAPQTLRDGCDNAEYNTRLIPGVVVFRKFHTFVPHFKTKAMKKITLKPQVFGALIFGGVFADVDNAANAAHPGSGASFTETQDEESTTLSFTDHEGNDKVAKTGDALKEEFDTDGTTFKGYSHLASDAFDVVEDAGDGNAPGDAAHVAASMQKGDDDNAGEQPEVNAAPASDATGTAEA